MMTSYNVLEVSECQIQGSGNQITGSLVQLSAPYNDPPDAVIYRKLDQWALCLIQLPLSCQYFTDQPAVNLIVECNNYFTISLTSLSAYSEHSQFRRADDSELKGYKRICNSNINKSTQK